MEMRRYKGLGTGLEIFGYNNMISYTRNCCMMLCVLSNNNNIIIMISTGVVSTRT